LAPFLTETRKWLQLQKGKLQEAVNSLQVVQQDIQKHRDEAVDQTAAVVQTGEYRSKLWSVAVTKEELPVAAAAAVVAAESIVEVAEE